MQLSYTTAYFMVDGHALHHGFQLLLALDKHQRFVTNDIYRKRRITFVFESISGQGSQGIQGMFLKLLLLTQYFGPFGSDGYVLDGVFYLVGQGFLSRKILYALQIRAVI